LTNEDSINSFIGTSNSLGKWIDSTSTITNGISFVSLVTFDFEKYL